MEHPNCCPIRQSEGPNRPTVGGLSQSFRETKKRTFFFIDASHRALTALCLTEFHALILLTRGTYSLHVAHFHRLFPSAAPCCTCAEICTRRRGSPTSKILGSSACRSCPLAQLTHAAACPCCHTLLTSILLHSST